MNSPKQFEPCRMPPGISADSLLCSTPGCGPGTVCPGKLGAPAPDALPDHLQATLESLCGRDRRALHTLQNTILEYRRRLQEAERRASYDALTGLFNRSHLEREIEMRIDAGVPFCLAMLDLDGFKKINDRYGHIVGDDVLHHFADALRHASRSTDILGRLGGDEFLLVQDGSLIETEAQLRRIRRCVNGTYNLTDGEQRHAITVEASAGLAEYLPGDTLRILLSRADAAMYADKATRQRLHRPAPRT